MQGGIIRIDLLSIFELDGNGKVRLFVGLRVGRKEESKGEKEKGHV